MANKTKIFAISLISTSLAVVGLSAFTLAWFNGPNVESTDNFLNGEIGLRNYFYQGDGTQESPYEIVQPIHYYNLTRLQNLGVFPKKTYFRVGSVFEIEGQECIRCISGYDEQGDPIFADYLDMGDFSSRYDVHTIGGEFAPFVSEIDGNGLPIRNLKVLGNPEDVGVFGYVAHSGVVKNMVFDNLEVTSLGYNNDHTKNDYLLFSQNIEDIFHSASYLATGTSLTLYDHNSTTDDYDAKNLKKLNGANGTQLTQINSDDNTISGTKYFNGYFKPTFPEVENDPFTYSIMSSSSLIVPVENLAIEGSSPTDLTFDFTPLYDSIDFNKGKEYQANAKIYLVASTKVDGVSFSRVIQSYTIEIYSKSTKYEDGGYVASIFCDYIDQGEANDKVTGYHHGVNVGLVAGHVDGSMKDCYVYNGTLTFNETGYHPVYAETDTALVGEVGKNVKNNMDPDIGLVVNGDIGIMNFSKIYGLIRSDSVGGTSVMAGKKIPEGGTSFVNYLSYKNFINPTSIDMFADYLRYYDGLKDEYEFISGTGTNVGDGVWHSYNIPNNVPNDFNTVDFLWNRVVEDEDDVDRGLGVFKIVSTYNADAKNNPDRYGAYMVNNIGNCRIVNEATNPKEKVIFSTAEYDHSKENPDNYLWNSVLDDMPKRATTLPSYSDVLSFEYPFSRDFDYCFELDLRDIEKAQGNDYMYNTDSGFLSNYLSSKLIDKYGDVCDDLHTDLHECLGHGSGQLLPGTDPDALKAYGNTIEEARADLFGLYYIADDKLVELGLVPDGEAYKSQYYSYIMNGLMTQLIRITPGNQIEEAHMRNRALIAHWCYEHGGDVICMEQREGKTYVRITDYQALRQLFARLLAEIQRIKSEGDYEAARQLVERYAVKVDGTLHTEVLERYKKLNLAPYKGFINPQMTPVYDDGGKVKDILLTYSESYAHQMLRYSSEYATLI